MSDDSLGIGERLAADLRRHPVVLPIVLALAVLILYSPVVHHEFLRWDDNEYVTENPRVSTGLKAENVSWAFTETRLFYWHPVTWLSHMLDCQLFGLNPGPHHLVNALLHAINVFLVFLLLQTTTGALWRSSVVAGLFAFHPLNVETVAWLAERKSLLSALFSLLALAAYGWYVRRPGAKRYVVVAIAFACALMAKPMAITLPLVFLALDYWPLNRIENPRCARAWAKFAMEKLPLLIMSMVSAALTVIGQRSAGAISKTSAVPVGMRFEQAPMNYVEYLRKIFWPVDLAAFYPYHPHWLPWTAVLGAAFLLLAISVMALRARRAPYLAIGWLLFLLILLPVSGIVQVGRVVIADRFAYLPAIGIFIAVVWAVGDLVESRRALRAASAAASVAVLAALIAAANYNLRFWHDGVTLFTRAAAVEKAPDSFLEDLLADSLIAARRIDDALVHYRRSCELEPQFDLCHYNIAEILFSRYNISEALEHYRLAGLYTTRKDIALRSLLGSAEAYLDLGDLESARRQLGYALTLDPNNGMAIRLLAQLNARMP